jgi:hypothetical protein
VYTVAENPAAASAWVAIPADGIGGNAIGGGTGRDWRESRYGSAGAAASGGTTRAGGAGGAVPLYGAGGAVRRGHRRGHTAVAVSL